MTIKEIFSRNLNRLLENAEISKIELSDWSGIPINTIYCYCRGLYLPSIENACKIAGVFRVSMEDLIKEK